MARLKLLTPLRRNYQRRAVGRVNRLKRNGAIHFLFRDLNVR